ncbi:dal80p-controlled protein [Exophiala xenobiotica]|nr:dal80p-controlled protein [Exophiala xenobiotica]KAK5209852.1 Protein dcg1 [Exophiala xenobiotica]KAK5225727.1 Protein dcg1 [Exophiala xenobiotica]KAK5236018.1 Protein dcg1 [Exophiala xenobiotica]KAK5253726.1 Protein dcg1 [Exophiala xenobiotica]
MSAEASASTSTSTPVRILVINPNTSQHMTDALKPVLEDLRIPSVEYTFFTSPSPGIASINSPDDAAKSADICLPALVPLLAHHDAFLVACYSQHPLVPRLKAECRKLLLPTFGAGAAVTATVTAGSRGRGSEGRGEGRGEGEGARKYVTGIFEASVLTSLSLIDEHEGFGIVSTGKIWESALQSAVEQFLGYGSNSSDDNNDGSLSRFYGCETTGLNASELHDLPGEEVRNKMMDATKRLLERGAGAAYSTNVDSGNGESRTKAICLGCAGMVGLEDAVRQACVEYLGPAAAKEVCIIDGVKAGVVLLCSLARTGF